MWVWLRYPVNSFLSTLFKFGQKIKMERFLDKISSKNYIVARKLLHLLSNGMLDGEKFLGIFFENQFLLKSFLRGEKSSYIIHHLFLYKQQMKVIFQIFYKNINQYENKRAKFFSLLNYFVMELCKTSLLVLSAKLLICLLSKVLSTISTLLRSLTPLTLMLYPLP